MGLLLTAAITTAIVLLIYGTLIWRLSAPQDRSALANALIIALPLQPLALYVLRTPIEFVVTRLIAPGDVLTIVSLFYAPLTEEPAKWALLLIPFIRRLVTPRSAIPLALAIGLGFGIGEIWWLALTLSQVPAVGALPFYAFGGFFIERLLVCGLHGAFIAFAFHALAHGRSFWPAAVFGAVLHFLANMPIYLMVKGVFGWSRATWGLAIEAYLLVMAVFLLAMVWRLGRKGRAAA